MRMSVRAGVLPRSFLCALGVTIALAWSPARTDAAILSWEAVLTGDQEIPANASTATGFGTVQYDTIANTLAITLDWAGLTDTAVQAHIHCCVTTPPANVGIALDLWLVFDPRPQSGNYSAFYDLDLIDPFRSTFVVAQGGTTTSALAAFIAAMDAGEGRAYFNIHTTTFPGGEIRGNIAAVPEPASLWLLLGGLGAATLRRRPRRSRC